MRGNEFIRKVEKYAKCKVQSAKCKVQSAKCKGIACEWRPDRGKGSHGVLILGDSRTVVRNPKDELKTGTYHAMLKQLGVTKKDI